MTETQLSKSISETLGFYEAMGKLVFVRNNSFAGHIQRKDGSLGYIKNNKRGASDYYVFFKKGVCVHLEIKTEEGKISKLQEEYANKIEKLDHIYKIVRSVDEADQLIKKHI